LALISASEKHNLLNFRASHDEAMAEHAAIMRRAHALGVRVIGCAGTVYGCPVRGDLTTAEVAKIVRFYLDEGAQTIMLGDTTGVANPKLVRERIGELMAIFPRAAFIAHFHSPFYVYQYATSFVASTALARGIREEAAQGKSTARRDAFLAMLAAGGSRYPIDLLGAAGVDMTTSRPFDATLAEVNATMDEMEAILARMDKAKPPGGR